MIVLSVEENSPSSAALLMMGGVILTMGGQPVRDFANIQEFLEPPHVGKQIPLRIYRAGQEIDLKVEIGQWPQVRISA